MFDFYPQWEYPLAAAQLALAMLGLGATLKPGDFLEIVRSPLAFGTGMVLQVVGIPALAALATVLFDLPVGLAVGLILVAAVPGGSVSNIFTYLGKGNVALSVALTGVCTLLCLVTTPFVLKLLASDYLPDTFEMPVWFVVREISLFLLVPLAVGMTLRHYKPVVQGAFSKWCIRASLFIIGIMVVGSLGSGRMQMDAFGWTGPLLIIGFCVVALNIGAFTSMAARFREADQVAVAIEVTVRNTNLALLLKASIFRPEFGADQAIADGALFVALFYGGTALVVVLFPVFLNRWRLKAAAAKAQ
jgi:BASS family bile acid:Na+ symporter